MSLDLNKDDRYFRIANFYTAAFLFSKGLTLVNIDKVTDPKRAYFVFLDTSERENLLENFNFAKEDSKEASVDVRKFITAVKMLKDKLYSDNF